MSDEKLFTQEELDAKIEKRIGELRASHQTAIKAVRDELAAAQAKYAELSPRIARVEELEAEIQKRDRDALFASVNVTDDTTRARIEKWYAVVREDFPEEERPDFAAWVREHAAKDPVIGPLLGAKPAQQTTTAAASAAAPTAAGVRSPAPPPAKMTDEQRRKAAADKTLEASRLPIGSPERIRAVADAKALMAGDNATEAAH